MSFKKKKIHIEEEARYVKIDYSEAYENKKNLLSAEISFLRISKSVKNYKLLRQEELNIKLKMGKKIDEINDSIKKLKIILPKIKIPEVLQETGEKSDIEKKIKISREKNDMNDLELQLQEIQDKLKQMSR